MLSVSRTAGTGEGMGFEAQWSVGMGEKADDQVIRDKVIR
jgi:hypothetical protein